MFLVDATPFSCLQGTESTLSGSTSWSKSGSLPKLLVVFHRKEVSSSVFPAGPDPANRGSRKSVLGLWFLCVSLLTAADQFYRPTPSAALGLTDRHTGFVGSASVSFLPQTKSRRPECILFRASMAISWQRTPCLTRNCLSKRHSSIPGFNGLALSWTTSAPSMVLTWARPITSCVLILMAMERMSSWLR